jgi:hypothetical protein
VFLASFFVQAHPAAATLREVVADVHLEDRPHAGESVNHGRDQGAIAQAGDRAGVDAGEEGSGFIAVEHGCAAFFHDVFRPAHRMGRVEVQTWPTTSQSKSIRSAARCCLTLGLDNSAERPSI